MSLSIACATNDVGPRFVAMLGQFRPVADEIVAAVDARVDPDELGDCARMADRLIRYEYGGFARTVGWLHGQCSSDWIMLIGSDELPSPALVEQIPGLIRAQDVVQYWLPTRWCYPDAEQWLDEAPWWPDYHNRLVRNDATLTFSGLHHSEAAPVFPARCIEAPIYHLDCVLLSTEERRSKAERYERLRPGLTAPGGGSLNATYYLPEDYARELPREIAERDRKAIATAIGARPPRRRLPTPPDLPLVRQAEIDLAWPGRELGAAAYRARIEPLERDTRFVAGQQRQFSLRVTNEGDECWAWTPEHARSIRVSYRLRSPDDELLIEEGPRSSLMASLAPGESIVAPTMVQPPDQPGEYVLEFDLVASSRWFYCSTRVPVTVVAER